jgi:hypothetical protein
VTKTPKEKRTEPGEVHPKYWERTTLEAFKNDPFRIAVELIKNAADSYTRLEKKQYANPPFEIFVKFFCRKKNPPSVEVLDYAEGMDSMKLKEALRYGTQTSMGEDTEAITSAEKGIGLKDAMMALKDNWLITIKEGLVNERNKHPDFTTGIGRENEEITDEEREKLEMPRNGTLVTGILPKYFHERKFTTICERLEQHFLIRKLLQNKKYRIWAISGWTREKTLLKYKPPNIEKQLLVEDFKIEHAGKEYKINLLVNRSSKGLSQGKPYGESGLLFFYGEYSVVDFTFCRFDRDLSFSKFFGEVKMEIETIIRDPNESPLVDEKRRGLDPEHPFNVKLFNVINQRLRGIQEEEEASRFSFDEYAMKDVIRELNKIYKEIRGKGPPPLEPPIRPDTFAFYPVYVSLKEYEPKVIYLIINSSIISDGLEISLQSTNPDIIVKKPRIEIEAQKPKDEFMIKQIQIYSEKMKIKGEIIATPEFPLSLKPEKMGVEVIENPIFSPANGFAFVPDKTTIVDGGEKKVELYVDRGLVRDLIDIAIESTGPISCDSKRSLPRRRDLEKYAIKNVVKTKISIKTRGTDHIGEKANIEAFYDGRTSRLNVTIIPEPLITGLFRFIRLSGKNTKRVSDFVHDEGIIEIYYKHPLIKQYMRKGFRKRPDFLVFVADTLTREAVKAVVLSGIKENSSRFPIFDMDHPEKYIEEHIIREYYEEGPRMHGLFMKLAREIRFGEE